jgi:hypothetical protein
MEGIEHVSIGAWATIEMIRSGLILQEAAPVTHDDGDDDADMSTDESDEESLTSIKSDDDDYSEEVWVLLTTAYALDITRRLSRTPYFKDENRWSYDLAYYKANLNDRLWKTCFRLPKNSINTIVQYLQIPQRITTQDRHSCYGDVTFLMMLMKYARPRSLCELKVIFHIDKTIISKLITELKTMASNLGVGHPFRSPLAAVTIDVTSRGSEFTFLFISVLQ